MSKKSEKQALKAYPVDMQETVEYVFGAKCKMETDFNETKRKLYQEGYEQAEKDVLKTAVGVIKNYCETHLLYEGARVKLLQFFNKEMKARL